MKDMHRTSIEIQPVQPALAVFLQEELSLIPRCQQASGAPSGAPNVCARKMLTPHEAQPKTNCAEAHIHK